MMPSGSWTCWESGLAGSALRCTRTRRDSSTSARGTTVGRRQTARRNRSITSASPTHGESLGEARTWCGRQRPKVALLARWPRSRTGAEAIDTSLYANSAPGCLRHSMVTLPTSVSRGIFGGSRHIATKPCGLGTSGWNGEREEGSSSGTNSTRSLPGTHCQRPGSLTATPDGTKLSREEPDALVALVRVCGGRGGQPPRLPGIATAPSDSLCDGSVGAWWSN